MDDLAAVGVEEHDFFTRRAFDGHLTHGAMLEAPVAPDNFESTCRRDAQIEGD